MTDDERFGSAVGRSGRPGEEYEWGEEPDLTSISEGELRARLEELSEEERTISYRRRVIQGRIDLIRAELIRRAGAALPPEKLARILPGEGRHGGGIS